MGKVGISRKNKIKNVHLVKMSLLVQIGGEISSAILRWLHINPFKIDVDRKRYNPWQANLYGVIRV